MSNSPIWWFPLARRILGWGAVGALLWALPVAVVFGGLALYTHLNPSPPDPSEGFPLFGDEWLIEIFLWLCGVGGAICAALGATASVFAAIYAAPQEGSNPLKSRFFRCVHWNTLWFTLAASALCGFTLGLLEQPIDSLLGFYAPKIAWFVFSIVCFCVGLWRAVNRALKVATASH